MDIRIGSYRYRDGYMTNAKSYVAKVHPIDHNVPQKPSDDFSMRTQGFIAAILILFALLHLGGALVMRRLDAAASQQIVESPLPFGGVMQCASPSLR